MLPSVTAVVPAFNAEKYIRETLFSLIYQSVPLKEIIIVDDGSTDQTAEVVQKMAKDHPQLQLLKNTANMGVSRTRNIAAQQAASDWIWFMDADDIADKTLVESYLSWYMQITKSNSVPFVLIHGAYQQMEGSGKLLDAITRFKQVGHEEILGYELVRNHVYLSGTIVNKEAFIKCGGFDNDLKYCEDWDLWLRLAQIGGFVYVDDPLVCIRRHTNNTSSSIAKVQEAEKEVLKKFSLEFIEEAINKRNLPLEENAIDFVTVLNRLNHWDKGKEALERILQSNPNYLPAYFFSGLYSVHQEQYIEAQNWFAHIVKDQPDDAAACNNLGVCLFLNGDHEKARIFFKRALCLIDGYMDANHNLNCLESKKNIRTEDLKFTWRKLRSVLLRYES